MLRVDAGSLEVKAPCERVIQSSGEHGRCFRCPHGKAIVNTIPYAVQGHIDRIILQIAEPFDGERAIIQDIRSRVNDCRVLSAFVVLLP